MTLRDQIKEFNSPEEMEEWISDQKSKYHIFNIIRIEDEDGIRCMYDKENNNYFPQDQFGGRSFGKIG